MRYDHVAALIVNPYSIALAVGLSFGDPLEDDPTEPVRRFWGIIVGFFIFDFHLGVMTTEQ